MTLQYDALQKHYLNKIIADKAMMLYFKIKPITTLYTNRPWWPSGLGRVSNSSRHSLKDPCLNPAWDYDIDRSEVENFVTIQIAGRRVTCVAYNIYNSSSNQSKFTTQISTCPRATQQGCIKCRRHVTVLAVPTQEAIPEESG